MGKVIEDWRDICFVDSVLEHIGNPHPSVIAVSVGIVKRYIEREAILTEKSFARVDDCGNRLWSDSGAVDTAKQAGMSLRRSLCLSDAYWNVPVEVQLHVTVLSNYLCHLSAMLRRAKEKAVVS